MSSSTACSVEGWLLSDATGGAPLGMASVPVRFRFAGDGEVGASGAWGGVRVPLPLGLASSVAMAVVMGERVGDARGAGGRGVEMQRAQHKRRRMQAVGCWSISRAAERRAEVGNAMQLPGRGDGMAGWLAVDGATRWNANCVQGKASAIADGGGLAG